MLTPTTAGRVSEPPQVDGNLVVFARGIGTVGPRASPGATTRGAKALGSSNSCCPGRILCSSCSAPASRLRNCNHPSNPTNDTHAWRTNTRALGSRMPWFPCCIYLYRFLGRHRSSTPRVPPLQPSTGRCSLCRRPAIRTLSRLPRLDSRSNVPCNCPPSIRRCPIPA